MKINIFVLLFHYGISGVLSQKGLQCFVPGECLDSQILDATPTKDSKECWRLCQNVTGCTWFTFYKDSQICTPLSGCLRLSDEKCLDNCISGEEECPAVQCGVHGRCYGALEGIRKVGSAKECRSICETHQECFWNTYDPVHESCLMTNDCPLLDRSCTNCSSSERNCVAESETSETSETSEIVHDTRNLYLLGADVKLRPQMFNMNTKNAHQCNLPPQPTNQLFLQFTTFGNQLHVCGLDEANGETAILCSKLDDEKKIWTSMDKVKLSDNQFLDFLNVPNGYILILLKTKAIHLYNGEKILQVTDKFPYSNDRFNAPFCRAVISKYEILVGFAQERFPNGKLSMSTDIYSINFRRVKTEVDKIKVPYIPLTNTICGAFGPEGNRKVAIFGGRQVVDGNMGSEFEKTLILDWNSKTFDMNGPNLFGLNPGGSLAQTIGYEDTFLYHIFDAEGTQIFMFDVNGTETKLPFLGKLPNRCMNLATVPRDVPECMQ